ncbi:multidrug effflux MFS transporter [uncultured Alsobacter sp.]|uniref:multidrug effflux MFS transporter n=1 Tax=uncultured Alsobacter sp. TaxID=1748258 RepID=UPI0025D61465|nr:multidrug effflux MFS transporter [uncultured Alsobacter sp.]
MRLRPDTLALTAVLGLMTALGPLSTDMYLPSLPAIAEAFGASTSHVQLTLSTYLVAFAVGQVIYGPLSDRYGRRPVLIASFSLYVLASGACAAAPSVNGLIMARALQALGAAGPIILARTVVRDLYDGHRAAREMARMGTIMGVVPAIAPALGGLLQTWFGWRASFIASFAGAAMLAAAVIVLLPETLRQRSDASISPLGILRNFAFIGKNPVFRMNAAIAALAYGGLFAFISGASFVLQGPYGLTPFQMGLSFCLVVVGYVSGTVLSRRVIGIGGGPAVIRYGTSFLAAGGVVMLALRLVGTGSFLEIVLPMMLYTCGIGFILPQTMLGAMQPFPERAGAASSLQGVTQMTSAALVGIAVAWGLSYSPTALPLAIAASGLASFTVARLSLRRSATG